MKLRFGVTAAEKKAWIVFLVLLGLTAAVLIISAYLGQRFIPPLDVAKTFFGAGSKLDELMIMSFRMPRILTALCAGCLFGSGRRDIAGARQKPSRIPGYYRNNGRSGGSGRACDDVLLRPQQFTYDQSFMASGGRIYRRLGCWAYRLFIGIQKWCLHISAGAYRDRIFNVGASHDHPADD